MWERGREEKGSEADIQAGRQKGEEGSMMI